MYFFSDWFEPLFEYIPYLTHIVKTSRGVKGWQSHSSPFGFKFFSLYHTYSTLSLSDCIIESHRNNIDLQFCYSGGEFISLIDSLPCNLEHSFYDSKKDKDIWLSGSPLPCKIHLSSGQYVLFKPHQLHQPQQFDGVNSSIEKIVLKLPSSIL